MKDVGLRNKHKAVLEFEDTGYYTHPSHVTLQSGESKRLLVLRERHTVHLPWILQFKFPDTATFGGANILECSDEEICDEMETYASLVLCLCHSYHCHEDI